MTDSLGASSEEARRRTAVAGVLADRIAQIRPSVRPCPSGTTNGPTSAAPGASSPARQGPPPPSESEADGATLPTELAAQAQNDITGWP